MHLRAYGPHKTRSNRWKRWGGKGIVLQMREGLAAASAEPKTVTIDATYLKAQLTASSPRVEKSIELESGVACYASSDFSKIQ